MADIFISYSKASAALTEQLAGDLEARGYTVWWDTALVSGESFKEVILAELSRARAAIVIWTRDSVKSDWVYSEATRARARGILIPLRDAHISLDDIPPPFENLHTDLISNRPAILAALAKLGVTPKNPGETGAAPRKSRRLPMGRFVFLGGLGAGMAGLFLAISNHRSSDAIVPITMDCLAEPSVACVLQGSIRGTIRDTSAARSCASHTIYKSDDHLNWKNIWTTSVYSFAPGGGPGGGLHDGNLKVGGWGDLYYSLLQFDPPKAPGPVKVAGVALFVQKNETPTVSMYVERITQQWGWQPGDRLWWSNKPNAAPLYADTLPAPVQENWYFIDITNLYRDWTENRSGNYGIQLRPTGNNNQFNIFASSLFQDATKRPRFVTCGDVPTKPGA